MRNIFFVAANVDFAMAENIIARIHTQIQPCHITLLCYDGSHVQTLKNYCTGHDILFIKIKEESFDANITVRNTSFLLSWKVYHLLKDQSIDEIHFIDLYGVGFHCIQAKRTALSFDTTLLLVEMLGTTQYNNELSEEWGSGGVDQLIVQYMERYCCQYCDRIIAPSRSMFDWAIEKRWVLSRQKSVQPFIADEVSIPPMVSNNITAPITIMYCGVLGKAGGIHIFVNALMRISANGKAHLLGKILFTGEYKQVDGEAVNDYLDRSLSRYGYQWEILGALNAQDLLTTARKHNAVLVYPSAQSFNTTQIRTAVYHDFSMIVSDTPAHRELFIENTLFPLMPADLVDALLNPKIAQRRDENLITNISGEDSQSYIKESEGTPLVSICTAYYNHGQYLNCVRSSIEAQDYPNIEWIVVDDGSTDRNSVIKLEEYRKQFADRQYRFFQKDNAGPAIARNYAASHASGKYLIFMDSDNVAKPNMVSSFVRAIEHSSCDCLTSYLDMFTGTGEVNARSLNGLTNAMLGACPEIGVFMNCFGDTNFIIKKEAFQNVGGFIAQRIVTEDWQILANLTIQEYKVDVIPKALFWYRLLPDSNIRFGSDYYRQQIVLETYCRNLPPYIYHLFNSLCRPAVNPIVLNRQDDFFSIYKSLMNLIDEWLPLYSKRRLFIKRVIRHLYRKKPKGKA